MIFSGTTAWISAALHAVLRQCGSYETLQAAEHEPMPVMLEAIKGEECKAFFVREAHAIILPA